MMAPVLVIMMVALLVTLMDWKREIESESMLAVCLEIQMDLMMD